MKISKQARREAKQLFQACLVGGLPDEERVKRAVSLLIEKKPRGYMAILSHFHRLLKLDIERRSALVESAVPLSDEQRAALEHNLSRLHAEGLQVAFSVNAGLIGGLRVKVGSDVYDSSVREKLNELRESF